MRRPENLTYEMYRDLRKKQRELDKQLLKGKLLFMSIPDLSTMKMQKTIADKEKRPLKFKGHVYKGVGNMNPVQQEDKSEEE